jgi:hypothetical protein
MAQSQQRKPNPPIGSHYVPVDAWTLKCLYNRSNYGAQITTDSLVELHRHQSPFRSNGTRTVDAYYGPSATRDLIVRLQWFENERFEITRSGQKDPKQIYKRGIDFHQHGGGSEWQKFRREPQAYLGLGHMETAKGRVVLKIQLRYGAWRRFKCSRFGPLEAANQVIVYATLGWIPRPAALTFLRGYDS